MSSEIFVVGNSWSIPSDEAPYPAFDILGLKNRWEKAGVTLDAQAEYIINNQLVNKYRVIWLIGHHHRADPRGTGDYLLPYKWGEGDVWGKLVQDLWFKKITRMPWYWRTNALFIKAVLGDATPDNLLLIPIYRPNVIDNDMISQNPCIWRHYLRDYVKEYPDGRGHMNQLGHNNFCDELALEVYERWKISLQVSGEMQSKLGLTRKSLRAQAEL
jgi:hypothetical protein